MISFFAFAIFFLSIISTTYAEKPIDAIRYSVRYLQGTILLAALATSTINITHIHRAYLCFVVGAIFSAAISCSGIIFPFMEQFTVDPSARGRYQGVFNHPNQLGLAMAMAIPLMLPFAKKNNLVFLSGLPLIFLGLFLSGSKLNIILGALNILLYIILLNLTYKSIINTIFNFFLSLLFIFLIYSPILHVIEELNPDHYSVMMEFFVDPLSQGTTIDRIDMYNSIINYIWQGHIFGVGAGNQINVIQYIHAHNMFLDIVLCLGIPGLIFFSILIYHCISLLICPLIKSKYKIITSPPSAEIYALMVAGFSYLISNLSSDSFGSNTLPLFWVCLGLSIAFQKENIHRG
jgi:O-antigen ligase